MEICKCPDYALQTTNLLTRVGARDANTSKKHLALISFSPEGALKSSDGWRRSGNVKNARFHHPPFAVRRPAIQDPVILIECSHKTCLSVKSLFVYLESVCLFQGCIFRHTSILVEENLEGTVKECWLERVGFIMSLIVQLESVFLFIVSCKSVCLFVSCPF